MNGTFRRMRPLGWTVVVATAMLLSNCSTPTTTVSQQGASSAAATSTPQVIAIDGSSTVFPITSEVVSEFEFERANTPNIEVAVSGTSGGFQKFCAGQTDINNASRPINQEEMAACRATGVRYVEMPVAFDALTIVVHPSNTWANDITVEELKRIWEPTAEGQITQWNQIRPEWPSQPITLYGPGSDSGTFDFFTEVIVGQTGASRKDYTASEDDTFLVRKVRNDPNALGYFGYAYYDESRRGLKALSIDSGSGPVAPSSDTVRDAQYQPLARPLFIYVNADKAKQNPELQELVEFYMQNARNLTNLVGYVPLPDEIYNIAYSNFQSDKVGTVFGGKSVQNLTIEELLNKETQF